MGPKPGRRPARAQWGGGWCGSSNITCESGRKGGESASLPITFSLPGGWGNCITYSYKEKLQLIQDNLTSTYWPLCASNTWLPAGNAKERHPFCLPVVLGGFAGVRRSLFFMRCCVTPHTNGL